MRPSSSEGQVPMAAVPRSGTPHSSSLCARLQAGSQRGDAGARPPASSTWGIQARQSPWRHAVVFPKEPRVTAATGHGFGKVAK